MLAVFAIVFGGVYWLAWRESAQFGGYKVGVIVRESNGSVSALEGSIQQEFIGRGARVIPLSSNALEWLKGATNLNCANEPADILIICVLKVYHHDTNVYGTIIKYLLDFRAFRSDGSIIGAGQVSGSHLEDNNPLSAFNSMASLLVDQIKVERKKQSDDRQLATVKP